MGLNSLTEGDEYISCKSEEKEGSNLTPFAIFQEAFKHKVYSGDSVSFFKILDKAKERLSFRDKEKIYYLIAETTLLMKKEKEYQEEQRSIIDYEFRRDTNGIWALSVSVYPGLNKEGHRKAFSEYEEDNANFRAAKALEKKFTIQFGVDGSIESLKRD